MHNRRDDHPDESGYPDTDFIEILLKSHRKEEFSDMFDAALDKWLEKKFSEVGKWTVRGVVAMVLSGMTYVAYHYGVLK